MSKKFLSVISFVFFNSLYATNPETIRILESKCQEADSQFSDLAVQLSCEEISESKVVKNIPSYLKQYINMSQLCFKTAGDYIVQLESFNPTDGWKIVHPTYPDSQEASKLLQDTLPQDKDSEFLKDLIYIYKIKDPSSENKKVNRNFTRAVTLGLMDWQLYYPAKIIGEHKFRTRFELSNFNNSNQVHVDYELNLHGKKLIQKRFNCTQVK